MDWSQVAVVALTVLVGVGAGMLSALLGVGGAVITTPAVRVLGATPIQAVGSTVPAILPGAVAGTLRYAREGLVDWQAALGLGLTGAVTAVAGALASDHVDGRLLMVLTAVLMLWSGVTVVRGRPSPAEEAERRAEGAAASETDLAMVSGRATEDVAGDGPSTGTAAGTTTDASGDGTRRHPVGVLAVLGAASGFVAGLLGVGGGIVMVPVLTGPLRVPMKSAVASSLVAVAIFSVPALVTHWALGHIDWAFALPLMVGVVPGARIGAHLTIGASERTVRLLFGALIIVLAVVYGASEASGLF